MALTRDDVFTALRDVNDPELPVNIVDLGLIYTLDLVEDPDAPGVVPRQQLRIEMTMTSRGCPAHEMILEQVRNRLAGLQELSRTDVALVWEPAWTPDRMSLAAQKKLGIAPPDPAAKTQR